MAPETPQDTVHFRATSRRRVARGTAMNVNLTPAIDITFLLLIFFVVSTRFAAVEGSLPSRLPQQQGVLDVTPLPISPIRVRVTKLADTYGIALDNWRKRPTSFIELTRMLEEMQTLPGFDAETPVVIIADDDVAWDHVTNCYNAIRRVGVGPSPAGVQPFENVSFAAEQP